MALSATNGWFEVSGSSIVGDPNIPQPRPTRFGQNDPDSVLAAFGWYRLWVDDGGPAPSPYYTKVLGTVTVNVAETRCERVDTWQEWTADQKRADIQTDIDQQRAAAEQSNVDLAADPGLSGLMDETNAMAGQKEKQLAATADGDLDAFDPTLNPADIRSQEVAGGIARQLASVAVPASKQTEVQTAIDTYLAIEAGGDPAIVVPEPPSSTRILVGIAEEDYGRIVATRTFDNPWWWLEFELFTKRQITPGQYWIALYDGTAVDDRADSTTGFLTTPQLTKVTDGHYRADRLAVNQPKPTTDDVFKFSLAFQHLSEQMFDKLTLNAGETFRQYRVRWAGYADYPGKGT